MLTINDFINWCNDQIKKYESHIEAANGLPGLYYDAEEVKGYRDQIEKFTQLKEYLEDYKKIKEEYSINEKASEFQQIVTDSLSNDVTEISRENIALRLKIEELEKDIKNIKDV